jgi:hypothetical protein
MSVADRLGMNLSPPGLAGDLPGVRRPGVPGVAAREGDRRAALEGVLRPRAGSATRFMLVGSTALELNLAEERREW